MTTERFLPDDAATEALGQELARRTPPGGTWLLRGPLGSGKTTWTRGFVAGLDGDPDQVASPTYAVLHRYTTPQGRVWHLDLYRLGDEGAWSLGLEDQLTPDDRLVVEWAGTDGPWPSPWVAELSLDADVVSGPAPDTPWGGTRGDAEGVERPGGPPSYMADADGRKAAWSLPG